MTLEWMKKQAGWVIGIFGIFILGGLVMMDRAGSYRSDRHHNIVGKVNGEEIPTDRFQSDLNNYIKGQEQQSGKAPEGLQLAQIRDGLFNFKVQSILIQKVFTDYQLYPSREEMMDYVLKHPQEVAGHIARYKGYEEMPPFLADSSIDQSRYENWLAQDSVYDRYSMRELEEQLRTSVIPQVQLQQILKSQNHRTALEETFSLAMRENKAKVKFYHVSADSFTVAADKFKDADLKGYYDAHPDSFFFHDDAARLAYVRIPLKPSLLDTNLMLDLAKQLKERAGNGEKFADLAKDYSNDPGSAEKGGKLEGLRGREGLDPAFANAAFALAPGQISEPVLSQFGYHIILLHDKKKGEQGDTAEKIEVSHILLKINAGTETVDSLMTMAKDMRESAQKIGLEAAAKNAKLALDKTVIFEKATLTPLGGVYVQGANSFAFSQFESKEKISEALQAEDGIYMFSRDAKFAKGRDFERAKPLIGALMAKEEKLALAKKELEAQKSAILAAPADALPARFGKAVLDSTPAATSADSWVPGFGYSSPNLFAVFALPVGQWSQIYVSDMGAVLAKVVDKASLTDTELTAKVQAAMSQPDQYQASSLYQEWIANLPKTADVENKMDMVYRN